MRWRESAACLLFLAFAVYGQSVSGTISGTVTDPDGKAVSGAQVQAKNAAGVQFQAKASASGSYALADLPAGTYDITVTSPGLRPFTKENVAVQAGETGHVDARLADLTSLGAVGEDRVFFAGITEPHDAPTGPIPRTPDGKPDFSGVWYPLRIVDPGKPDPLPWAEALSKERVANNLKDVPSARCLPFGITRGSTFFSFRIMQNETVLAILYEEDLPRQIYLDGRKHPEESLSPFVGHSVGKWEGDTLVVDTVGFNDKTWLDPQGHPHTDELHLIESYHRKDLGHLEVEVTIDDPGAYKRPWTMKRKAELAGEDQEIGQYVCTENNRDVQHLVGK